ncbi:hypothetical protein KR222_004271 [Zaprionus bogoriensis]|nr:hypothetical protein KR222_004271 [Zaprionus bogoriensis]
MSVKSSARIKKRRSAEAAAATAKSTSGAGSTAGTGAGTGVGVGPFAGVGGTQRLSLTCASSSSSSAGGNNNNSSSSNSGNNNSNSNSNSNPSGNTGLGKKHTFVGRNPNFDTDETKLLIQLWGDPKLQRTLITTHKKHAVICQLAAKMQEYGYHRSPDEITTRIKNLKCFYNRLKKDKECGLTGDGEPSWKHFAEMDAIMTRPIFSVRPNEVPAPSLKYQLEQALEEHAERRKRRLENGEEVSESENDEDEMILSSPNAPNANGKSKTDAAVESEPEGQLEIDVSEESFADKRSKAKRRKVSSETEVDIDEARIKTEPAQQLDSVPEPSTITLAQSATVATAAATPAAAEEDDDCMLLPLPKEEPIDVDAVEESAAGAGAVSPAPTAMPTLADMLQLPKATNLLPYSGANVIIPANSISTSVATASTAGAKLTAPGKISLVPTNFLMQPKQANSATAGKTVGVGAGAQLQLLQSAINQGARLMISGAAPVQPVQAATNAGQVVTGPGGVKFVLVNAEQAAAAKAVAAVGKVNSTTALASAALPQAKLQQQLQQQQQQLQQQQQQQQQQTQQQTLQQEKKEEKRRAQEKAREEQQSKRHMTTMRMMLRQLLNSQNEANEIQHNRLSLERERLDWEKSMGERLLTLLPTLLQPAATAATGSGSAVQAAAQHPSPQFIVSAAAGVSTSQRLQPPKLLFTTALPMANGTVSMPHILNPSTALATSLPKVIAAPVSTTNSTGTNNGIAVAAGAVGAATAAAAGTIVNAKPVEICTQINDVQLVTPKLEKEG